MKQKLFQTHDKFIKVIVLDNGEVLCDGRTIGYQHEFGNNIYNITYQKGTMFYINNRNFNKENIIKC